MNGIGLDQLNAFLHVARLGGVGKAADALRLTQPAVTARIRNLEQTIGSALFSRGTGGMRLTERGELLLKYAEKFESLHDLMTRDIVAPDALEGRLRIGVSETIAQCWLPELIARLHERHPRLEIEFNVDISTNLRAALLDRALDLAVLLGPISEYTVENVELPGFDLAWYVSATAPHCDVPVDYLKRPVLTYARQTRPYRELRELLLERVGPDVAMFPSSSLSTCFRLVEADLGVAALPRALGSDYVARGTIKEFDPGWVPSPLNFTATYLAEPRRTLCETAARLARDVAFEFADHKQYL
ncbi:LysR family transcriptional regulator [Defluviimonas sp. WL0050]|uniref:LysR family transcriptional regulator n=1 Tax=Albidovulum litorale TaxID=2984134 RepID=A0ABT2ZR55_9RHOB|nr:LysR family transcriptional regulator [Defluviimonas sp. WL0050]MCV2873636.1 LysR family transcriptional regulator [Defluviimonas sp. WL0050]